MRAVRQCPVDPTPVVEELVDVVELRFRYGAAVVHRTNEPVVWMTQRQRLDAFLLDAARERGVEVREGVKISIEPDNTVSFGNGEKVRGQVLVGADGANGITGQGGRARCRHHERRRVRRERPATRRFRASGTRAGS